jgi:hypothetical protein
MNVNNADRQQTDRLSIRSLLIGVAFVGAGWLIGSVASRPQPAQAQVINAAPDQHFLSGDQISVPILQDIANTLHQMDARLGRLEVTADRLANEHGTKKNFMPAPEAN